MNKELIIVLDFGGQYNQLIARRVRESGVYCEVHPYKISIEKLKEKNPKGIILTGGPNSVYGEDGLIPDEGLWGIGHSNSGYLLWCTADDPCAGRQSVFGIEQRVWQNGDFDRL